MNANDAIIAAAASAHTDPRHDASRVIRAPRGSELTCKNWLIEAQFAAIRERVACLEQDRYLALDIEAMRIWAQPSTWPAALTQCLPSFA